MLTEKEKRDIFISTLLSVQDKHSEFGIADADSDKIILICDQLNTHKVASLL